MAVCSACEQEMGDFVACTDPVYEDMPGFERIPYPPDLDSDWPANCRDCGVPIGGLHHPGCCVERCPAHPHAQSISCDCAYAEVT